MRILNTGALVLLLGTHALLPGSVGAQTTILGGGKAGADCYVGISIAGAATNPVTCQDGAACDSDGAADGKCTFSFQVCEFLTDPSAACTAQPLTSLTTNPATLDTTGLVPGQSTLTCGGNSTFVVNLRGAQHNKPSKFKKIKLTGKVASAPKKDVDVIKFKCTPGTGGGTTTTSTTIPSVTECPTNASGGPSSLVFSVVAPATPSQSNGSNLSTGWTGASHGFPITPNAKVTMCLSDCDGTTDTECTGLADTGPTSVLNGANFGAPLPLLAGGAPVCVVNKFNGNVTGTADVGTGVVLSNVHLASEIWLTTTTQVCPRCTSGKCDSGAKKNQNCTVDGTLRVVNSVGPNKIYPLSRDCPPGGTDGTKASTLDILLPLTTGTSTLAKSSCTLTTANGGVPFQDRPNGCAPGSCSAGSCSGSSACPSKTDDPANPGQQICVDIKGGTNLRCCPSPSSTPCFDSEGGSISRTGLASAPVAGADPNVLTATEVLVADFCVPATKSPSVDQLTGLPGLGETVLPVTTTWSK